MSVKVSSWAWHDEATAELNGNEMILLLALADVADDNGRCRFLNEEDALTYDGLARKVRVDRRTIERLIPRLRERGLVEQIRGAKGRPNEFAILVPWAVKSTDSLSENSTDKMSGNGGDSPTAATLFPDNGGTRSSLKRIDVNSDHFDAFWAVYPRKVGRASAYRAFVAAVKHVAPSTVINGARRFAEDPNLPEKQFVPHPTTWLHRGGWDDEVLPVRDSVARLWPDAAPVSVPWWVPVMKVPVEEYLERRSETGWVESMQALAAQRAS